MHCLQQQYLTYTRVFTGTSVTRLLHMDLSLVWWYFADYRLPITKVGPLAHPVRSHTLAHRVQNNLQLPAAAGGCYMVQAKAASAAACASEWWAAGLAFVLHHHLQQVHSQGSLCSS
jgi:hypothetical protein